MAAQKKLSPEELSRIRKEQRAEMRKQMKEKQGGFSKLVGGAPWDKHPELYDPEKEPPQDPELARRLALADAAFRALPTNKTGRGLQVNSAVRNYDAQRRERDKFEGKGKGAPQMANDPDKHPGREWFHVDAVDIQDYDDATVKLLAKYGLWQRYGEDDKVHFEVDPKWVPAPEIKKAYKDAYGFDPKVSLYAEVDSKLRNIGPDAKKAIDTVITTVKNQFARRLSGEKPAVEKWNENIALYDKSKALQDVAKIIEKEEDKSTILPKGFLRALAMSESVMNHNSTSKTSAARGPFQFMPDAGTRFNLIERDKSGKIIRDDRMDVAKSAVAARKYAETLWKMFGGDADKVAAAYNMGEGALSSHIDKYPESWTEGKAPAGFNSQAQEYVPKFRHYFKHFAGENVANTVLPKERPWLKADAPVLPRDGKGLAKGAGVNAPPAAPILTETRRGVQPVPSSAITSSGAGSVPSAPAQTPTSSGGLARPAPGETFTAGPVTQPSRSGYQGQPVPNNVFTPDPSRYLQAAPEAPPYMSGGYNPVSNVPSDVFSRYSVPQSVSEAPAAPQGLSSYAERSPQPNIFTPDPSTYLQAAPEAPPYMSGGYSPVSNVPSNIFTPNPEAYYRPAPPAPDIYAGIEGGMEGNPPWPGSGPLAPQRPSSYVEQNPPRDVFREYAVQQPSPTYLSGEYNPIPSPRMYNGRMVEQPAPQAMEPFTPRSTYVERSPARDIFTPRPETYLQAPPEAPPYMSGGYQPISTMPRDILTPRPETYFRPAPETPMASQGRSMYAEQQVPRNVFTPNPDTYYRPEPPAPPYDSGNYQATSNVPSDIFSRYSVQQPAPVQSRVSMSFPPPPQDSGNYRAVSNVPSDVFSRYSVQQPAPVEPPSRFGSYYGSPYEPQQQVKTSMAPEPTFPPYEYDWYDQLMSLQQAPSAAQDVTPGTNAPYPVEDWQDQLDSYYYDTYGIRYQPEAQGPARSVPQPARMPESYPPQDIDLDEPAASALGTVNWTRPRR